MVETFSDGFSQELVARTSCSFMHALPICHRRHRRRPLPFLIISISRALAADVIFI